MLGKVIGPYRILQKIAQGGMSTVYKGLHIDLEQEVAVKVLSAESLEDPYLRERFINEAKIQAKLSHPNVIKTLNYLELDGSVFMIMEYVNGETLDVLLKKIGPLPLERAVKIFTDILDAVEFMHSKGIIHRDIKPANIMLSYDRFVKVMDFGIAKVKGEPGKTKAGIRIGTLWYMSPEQIRGEEASALTDIYSLGVTLYQMVTGRVPFTGETEFAIMKGHIEETATPPWKINGSVPRELGEAIMKALAKKPSERYQSIREFSEAVRSSMKAYEMNLTRAIQIPENLAGHLTLKRWRPLQWALQHRLIITVVALAVSALGLLAVWAQGRGKTSNPPAISAQKPVQTALPAPISDLENPEKTVPGAVIMEMQAEEKARTAQRPLKRQPGRSAKAEPFRAKKVAVQAETKVRTDGQKTADRPASATNEVPASLPDDGGWRIRK